MGATLRSVSFVGSVSGGLAGRGCERKGPGRKAGEDRHEVSYPPEADHHKASSAACCFATSHRVCGGGPPAHTGATRARVLCAERGSSAHGRVLNEGVVCVEMPFCIQEVASGDCCERKRPRVHTGGIRERKMGAETGPSAHGKRDTEGAIGYKKRLTKKSI